MDEGSYRPRVTNKIAPPMAFGRCKISASMLDAHVVDHRVLVIDTSTDYIDHIDRHYPLRAVFVTDHAERARGKEEAPDDSSEILIDARQPRKVVTELRCHLARHHLRPSGVACFDCDSLRLASFIAGELGLSYPSERAVCLCRSKLLSKERWSDAGLDCPAAAMIERPEEVNDFAQRHGGKVIVKPLTGSGSELIFVCTTFADCVDAVSTIRRRLRAMPDERMYDGYQVGGRQVDPRQEFLVEEYVEGVEYSCDFIIDGDRVQVVRLARKWLKPDPAPGIALAYQVPGKLPSSIDQRGFEETLRRAAQALDIERALCMLDFLVCGTQIVLLELAPRPGGDCLPPLLRLSCGLDTLGLELDVAEQRAWRLPEPGGWRPLVGLRLFAPREGEISELDASALRDDPRVEEVKLTREAGHRVFFPPEDYHSRILGYAIFSPAEGRMVQQQCIDLQNSLKVRYTERS